MANRHEDLPPLSSPPMTHCIIRSHRADPGTRVEDHPQKQLASTLQEPTRTDVIQYDKTFCPSAHLSYPEPYEVGDESNNSRD